MWVWTGLSAAALVLIHVFVGRLRFLDIIPRSRWLSLAGGIAVAYIFLHVLPELASHQSTFAKSLGVAPEKAEAWIYGLALVGLVSFYGLERAVKTSRQQARARKGADRPASGVFWIHTASFTAYNLLIGYLLIHREKEGLWSLVIYAVAMALHFVTNDFGLRQDHQDRYDHVARWLLAGGILLGWALGLMLEIPAVGIGFFFAFLAGGVMLNVLKEELPEERRSSFWPFLCGVAGYGAILLVG